MHLIESHATRTASARDSMLARLVAGLCIAAAGVVIAGWVFRLPPLTTFGRAWTPMVVSTSLVVLLGALAIVS